MLCEQRAVRAVFPLGIVIALCMHSAHAADPSAPPKVLVYPRPEVIVDDRGAFPLHVLQLALRKAEANYTLTQSGSVMDQERALRQLETPRGGIDVTWTMTSVDRERRLLPIRIPVDRGLFGWRLAIISQKKPDLFKAVHDLNDLKKFVACQGHDWPDTAVLRNNGIRVAVDPYYQNLFTLVSNSLADFFPRSSLEIWKELETHPDDNLMLDPYIVLHYPAAMYFFVNKSNQTLADAITKGMQIAIADGSFNKVFEAEYGNKLHQANFAKRRIIELVNPDLPAATPVADKRLWLSPDAL